MYKIGVYRLIMHYMHVFFIDMYAYRCVHACVHTYLYTCMLDMAYTFTCVYVHLPIYVYKYLDRGVCKAIFMYLI